MTAFGHGHGQVPFEDPRRVLARHGIRPRASWSQCFLVSAPAVARIAELVGGGPNDTVVEIGAGLGTLTRALAVGGARVVAIEPERDAARVLRAETATDSRVEVLEADALEVDLAAFAASGRLLVAGNLPYAIAAPILVRVTETAPPVTRAVLMVQAEVAARVAARPGGKVYGALSVAVQATMRAHIGLSLGPASFHPRPKVRSAVLVLEPIHPPPVSAAERVTMRPIVRAAFERRRKTLKNALAGVVADAATVERALAAAGIDPRRRGETLDVAEFRALALALGYRDRSGG